MHGISSLHFRPKSFLNILKFLETFFEAHMEVLSELCAVEKQESLLLSHTSFGLSFFSF